mgnify:CR=1 FL=1
MEMMPPYSMAKVLDYFTEKKREFISPKQIAKDLNMSKAGLSHILTRCNKKKYLERQIVYVSETYYSRYWYRRFELNKHRKIISQLWGAANFELPKW